MVEDREVLIKKLNNALRHYPVKGRKAIISNDRIYVIGKDSYSKEVILKDSISQTIYYTLSTMDLCVYVYDLNSFKDSIKTSLTIKPFNVDCLQLTKIPKNQLQFSIGNHSIFIDISRTSYIKLQNFFQKNTSRNITFKDMCSNFSNRENIKILLRLSLFTNNYAN